MGGMYVNPMQLIMILNDIQSFSCKFAVIKHSLAADVPLISIKRYYTEACDIYVNRFGLAPNLRQIFIPIINNLGELKYNENDNFFHIIER